MHIESIASEKVVPPNRVVEHPKCKKCQTPFYQHEGIGGWFAACTCLKPNAFNLRGYGDEAYHDSYPPPEAIGRVIETKCLFCGEVMEPGTKALLCSYHNGLGGGCYQLAHPGCANAAMEKRTAYLERLKAASSGILIEFRYPHDAEYRLQACLSEDGASRPVPHDFPALPDTLAIKELFRRPFAIGAIYFPSREEAESFWQQATQGDRTYELTWFEPGEDTASRSWGQVSRASAMKLELDHQTLL